jgi:hypothetical protein
MIPHLVNSERSAAAGAPRELVPPLRFRPLISPTHIRVHKSPYVRASGTTGAQKSGLRYEAQIQRNLQGLFASYEAGTSLHFLDSGSARTAQPDGIIVYSDYIFVFEIKYQHCPEAWWQLERLYKPLLQLAFPRRPISVVEICRSYDPSMPFPCRVTRFDDLVEWVSEPQEGFGVLEWRRP